MTEFIQPFRGMDASYKCKVCAVQCYDAKVVAVLGDKVIGVSPPAQALVDMLGEEFFRSVTKPMEIEANGLKYFVYTEQDYDVPGLRFIFISSRSFLAPVSSVDLFFERPRLDAIKVYRKASYPFSGDFFFCLDEPFKVTGVCTPSLSFGLGDVEGSGIEVHAMASFIKGLLYTELLDHTPQVAFRHLHHSLRKVSKTEHTVALTMAMVFETTVEIVSMGGPPVFLEKNGKWWAQHSETPSMDVDLPEICFSTYVDDVDRIVMFSDGLFEIGVKDTVVSMYQSFEDFMLRELESGKGAQESAINFVDLNGGYYVDDAVLVEVDIKEARNERLQCSSR